MNTFSGESAAQFTPEFESEPNFQGNEGQLLFSRMTNKVIKDQIVELEFQERKLHGEKLKDEVWEPYVPQGWTGQEKVKFLKGKSTHNVVQEHELAELLAGRSRQKLRADLEKRIREAMVSTDIDYSLQNPTSTCIPINWKMPGVKTAPTLKQKSIMAAHEKGHAIRPYFASFFDKYFQLGFEPEKIDFTEEDLNKLILSSKNSADPDVSYSTDLVDITLEDGKRGAIDYIFSAAEIAERMSQLKGYFGMSGNEQFTREHLHYAREHYIKDTGMDNSMTHFFQAITPETEDKFIEIINSAGI